MGKHLKIDIKQKKCYESQARYKKDFNIRVNLSAWVCYL